MIQAMIHPGDWVVRRIVVLTLLIPLVGLGSLAATAQILTGSITVTVYKCPLGMIADTLEPEGCTVASEGFGLNIASTEADIPARTLADATFTGTSFVYDGLPVGKSYLIAEARPPGSPYTSVEVVGEDVQQTDRGPVVMLTNDDPSGCITDDL